MDKLKVVIVEDEYYVRKGIIQSIPWEKLQCEIVGEAGDGKTGIQVIEETKPDFAIVDIEMPVMDGLEMVNFLKKKQYSCEYIFLTAHEKFTYVHSALKLEATDYLLKPFSEEDLTKAVDKVRIKLHKELETSNSDAFYLEQSLEVNNEYIKKAVDYVRKYYPEEISNITISEYLDLSPAYFCRLFKKETGYTFVQYLTNYRIHVAAGLLANFDMKVNEVADQVGISDNNYFTVIFKKIMNVTPKEYQEKKRK